MEGYCGLFAQAISETRPVGQPDPLIRERYDTRNAVLDELVERFTDLSQRAGWEVNPADFRRWAL